MAMKPESRMIEYLLKLKIEPDEPDYDKQTPFQLISKNSNINDNEWESIYKKLISLKVRIDYPDVKERTPFLNFYEN